MFCSNCGTQLKDDAKFCKECGTKTTVAAGAASPPRPARSVPRRQATFPEEPAARTRTVLIIVGIVVLGAAGFFLWKSGDGPEESTGVEPISGNGASAQGISEIDRVASGLDIQGVITLGNGVTAPSGGSLYIMARPAATPDQRAPLAAEKTRPSAGNTPFVIGPDNVMLGGDFNQPMVLTVRWDQDGDPLTKQIGDLTGATAGPVNPGDRGVKIILGEALKKAEIHPTLLEDGAAPGTPGPEAASPPSDRVVARWGEPDDGAVPDGAPKKITGRLILGDAVKAPKDGTVFVIARPVGQSGGPPAAVVRLTPGAEGLTFSLGAENMMMGGSWGGPYNMTARWDQDGNAMTKQPGDLSGAAKAPANAGDKIEIILDKMR